MVLAVGLVALLLHQVIDMFESGSGWAELPVAYALNLPFLLAPVLVLYFVLETYFTAVGKAEDELGASERRYRDLFEDSPISLWELDFSDVLVALEEMKGTGVTDIPSYVESHPEVLRRFATLAKVTDVNQATLSIYGVKTKEELMKMSVSLFSRQGATGESVVKALAQGKTELSGEFATSDVEGGTRYVSVRWKALHGAEKNYSRTVFSVQDVTERRLADVRLKESEERFRSLFENSPIPLLEIDVSRVVANIISLSSSAAESVSGTAEVRRDILGELISYLDVRAVNRRSVELFEASGKEELISRLGDVLTDDTAMKLAEGMAEMMTGSLHFVGETKAKTLRGKEIYVSVDWSPALSSEGFPTRMVVAFNDVTRIKKAEEELRAVASLPEENPSPVLRLASDGTISYSNSAGRAILQAWDCKVGGLAPQVWRETVGEVLAEKGSRIMEMEYGGVFYSICLAPFHEGGYVNLYASDITERERMTSALRESSERFRAAFENASLGAALTSLDGRWLRVNQALADMIGHPAEELVGRSFFEFLLPEDRKRVERHRERLLAGDFGTYTLEQRFVRRDGRVIWVSSNVSMVHGPSGESLYTVALIADITEKKLAEEELKNAERRFRELVEGASAGIWTVDAQGRTTYTNKRMAEMLGCEVEEMMGRSFFDFMDEVGTEKAKALMKRREEGISETHEFEFIKRNGSRIYATLSTNPVLDFSGRYVGAQAVVIDITARKLAEEELKMYSKRLEDLVEVRTAELEESHRKLIEAERMATIGGISTQLAHDLRNPLAGIQTESYLLAELLSGSEDRRVEDTLKLLTGSVAHAGKIIEDLLEYTRMQEPMKSSLDLASIIEETVAARPIPKGIDVVVRRPPRARILAEKGMIQKALRNVMDNAVDAMPNRGKLTISCSVKDGFAEISVADTGAGMGEAALQKLFLPFRSTKATGLGLGLPIAKKIVEAHGGSIRVESRAGEGTKFTVKLPLATG